MKSVCIQSFSGPYFPAFGLSTEIYFVSIFSAIAENIEQKNSEYTLGSDTEIKTTEVRINISQKGKIVVSN